MIRELVNSPALHAEAVALVPILEAQLVPASARDIGQILFDEIMPVYTNAAKSPAEKQALARIWAEDLEGLPAWAITKACVEYRREIAPGGHFPKPGEILKLGNKIAADVRLANYRAKQASKHPIQPMFSKDDAETRRKAIAELAASISPTTADKQDEQKGSS